jgi:hypothetical protein
MPPQQPPSRDPYADAQKLSEALTAGGHHPLTQTWHVLCAIAEMEYGSPHRDVTTEDVLRVLRRVTASVKQRILASFRACIAEIHYERRETTASNISLTSLKLEIPFWVLRQQGESCAVEKVAEIICCYYGIYGDPDRYEELLEELRQRDRVLWERCILQVLESGGIVSLHRPIQYLIRVHEPIYLPQCRERLEQGAFDRSHVDSLLAYLSALRPPWYREALQQYYTRVKKLVHQRIGGGRQESLKPGQGNGAEGARALSYWDQFCPLLLLMSDDDDWAWREFAHRLRREDVPLQHEEFPGMRHMHFPDSSARLPVLADWYALMRRKRSAEDMNPFDLARSLLERIVTIDGESAIQELRRLQRTHAFPDARWLSHAMFRIEDRLLTAESMPWESGLLLDFINKEHLGVIRHEHDLFEWVCQAIEDVQESLERRGEGVAGFWKGHMPHHEASCQNILWAFLRLTIQRSAIAAVEGEEKCIGRNRCDFWVEYPRRGADAFRVGVELKVARAGYGAAELVQPVETQLWDKYLRPTGCRHGIFVVLWFRDNRRYHGPVHWDTRNALAEMLRKRCKELEQQHGVSLTSYVIDLTRPFRER